MKATSFFNVWRSGRITATSRSLLLILAVSLAPSIAVTAEDTVRDSLATSYSIKTFDVPESSDTVISSINDRGDVTGSYVDVFSQGHAFVYASGVLTTLEVPGSQFTNPCCINARGQVAGNYSVEDTSFAALGFIFSAGSYATFDISPGDGDNVVKGLSRGGSVTGYFNDGGTFHGFVYSNGVVTSLDFPGAQESQGNSINDRGEVAGWYRGVIYPEEGSRAKSIVPNPPILYGRAFIYHEGEFTTLENPPDYCAYFPSPTSINNEGEFIGGCAGSLRGFLYSAGRFTSFDFPGAQATYPMSINDSGEATGSYTDSSDASVWMHGFLYRNGAFIRLDVPDARITYPKSINHSGQVAGWYSDDDDSSHTHGFIATPVVAILDDFKREDGRLGSNWAGRAGLNAYRIVDQKTDVGTGGPVYSQPNPFGLDQEAFVTLSRIDPQGAEQGLLLKAQGDTGNYRKGAIAVKYDAGRQVIRVTTWRPRKASWRNYRDLPAAFADGDKLGARVLADGKVRIFRNDQRVGRITLGPVDRQFFNERTGRAGLWFENAPNAIVDDFGGGTRMP